MPRSCPPLRSNRVGWHGRRVRTRLRLILERVFWFVNGGMSRMFVGDDGACVGATDGWPFATREVCVVYGREVLRCAQNDIWGLGSGLRWKDGVVGCVFAADDGVGAVPIPPCGQNPWASAFAGATVERGAVGLVFAGDDEGCVRFHAPHLGSGLRRKDGRRGRGLRGFGGFRRLMERWVGGMSQTGEEGFETSSLHPGQLPLMKSAARSAMASTVRLRFARTVSGMIDASMMRSPSTP